MAALRLLTIGHSYTVSANRRLARAIQQAGAGRWCVTVAAPTYFRGHNDIRPAELRVGPNEVCPVVPLRAYATGFVHGFFYSAELRSLLARGWDMVHAWEEPYILAGGQIAWGTPAPTRFVVRSAQSLPKCYPRPFAQIERGSSPPVARWTSLRPGRSALAKEQTMSFRACSANT